MIEGRSRFLGQDSWRYNEILRLRPPDVGLAAQNDRGGPLCHLLSGKSYVYSDRGETALKGFEDAARLFEVRWQEE